MGVIVTIACPSRIFLCAWAMSLMPMIDQGEKDDKIINACASNPEYMLFNNISKLLPHRLLRIRPYLKIISFLHFC